jgi:hypothetical protein
MLKQMNRAKVSTANIGLVQNWLGNLWERFPVRPDLWPFIGA